MVWEPISIVFGEKQQPQQQQQGTCRQVSLKLFGIPLPNSLGNKTNNIHLSTARTLRGSTEDTCSGVSPVAARLQHRAACFVLSCFFRLVSESVNKSKLLHFNDAMPDSKSIPYRFDLVVDTTRRDRGEENSIIYLPVCLRVVHDTGGEGISTGSVSYAPPSPTKAPFVTADNLVDSWWVDFLQTIFENKTKSYQIMSLKTVLIHNERLVGELCMNFISPRHQKLWRNRRRPASRVFNQQH